jgi:hypothetical protein
MMRDADAPRTAFLPLLVSVPLALFAMSICSGCGSSRPSLPTVNGPESQDLTERATGCVVLDEGGITAIGLRDQKKFVVRPPCADDEMIWWPTGPDAEGWVVFVSSNMEKKTYQVKAIKIGTSGEEKVFQGLGDALWDNPISAPLLAPRGGNVAVLRQPFKEFAQPIESGPIDIWNIHTKTENLANVLAMNDQLSWFPDGKHLAYVQPGEPPMVYILDVDTGVREPVRQGTYPIVGTDGASILLNMKDRHILVDVKTKQSRIVDWPGQWGYVPIALLPDDLVLYSGLPTTGASPKYTTANSPLVGPKPMGTLKLADFSSGKFQTIIPYLDPRTEVSFGVSPSCP